MKQSQNLKTELADIKQAFTLEAIISRLLAAWCTAVAILLYRSDGAFYELSFLQEGGISWGTGLILPVVLFFILLTAISLVLPEYPVDSWGLGLGSTLCVLRWLLTYRSPGGMSGVLFALGTATVWSLFLVYVLKKNRELIAKIKPGKWTVILIVAAFGILSFVILSVITCFRYKTFCTPNFDFGLFVNMFHNMRTKFEPLVTSERDMLLSHFAVHMSPIYYILLPAYALFPYPETLQIGQALFLLLGLIPLYLLCRHYKLSGKTTLLVTFLYAFYPALSTGCFYDLHENCFLPFFLLFTFYFFEKNNYPLMFISSLLVLCVKEDAAVYIVLFALYILFARRKWLAGSALALFGVGWFLFATGMIERLGGEIFVYRFGNLIYDSEDGLIGAVKTAFINPGYFLTQLFTTPKNGGEKFLYFLQLFLPLGMLPFCTKKCGRWLLSGVALINLLSNYVYQYDLGFQYHFGIAAFLIYAVVQNLPDLEGKARETLLPVAAIFCVCLYAVLVMPKLSHYTGLWRDYEEDYIRMEAALEKVPEDASVVSSTFLLAHIADRDEIYEIGYHDGVGDVEYVVLDIRYGLEGEDQAYLKQGYTVWYEEEGLIRILIAPGADEG